MDLNGVFGSQIDAEACRPCCAAVLVVLNCLSSLGFCEDSTGLIHPAFSAIFDNSISMQRKITRMIRPFVRSLGFNANLRLDELDHYFSDIACSAGCDA